MKFFHIADVHLGATPDKGFPWSYDRGREIWESFQNVIRQAGRENVGLFLIAGDLFHRQPLLKELKEVNALFASIPNTKIVLIAGNHDYIKENSFYKKISWAKNVFWLSKEKLSYVDLADLGVRVYGFSYHSREILEARYNQMQISSPMPVNILLAHGGDESHIPISGDTFRYTPFDYVALGHIHSPQQVGRETIRYCGTPLKYSFSEAGQQKSVTVVILREKGNIQIRTVPLKPLHDMSKLRGTYLEVTAKSFYEQFNREDYVQITLTDEEDVPDGMQKLRVVYPNLMRLEYDNKRTREGRLIEAVEKLEEKSGLELFEEFYELQNNSPMSERQRSFAGKLMEEIDREREV